MKFSQIERGGSTIFLLLPGGIKNLTESFIPFLPHLPPPRELKNDNSLKSKESQQNSFQLRSLKFPMTDIQR